MGFIEQYLLQLNSDFNGAVTDRCACYRMEFAYDGRYDRQ